MAQPNRPTPLWRNVSFTLMWTSTAASGFGDRMIMLAALALLGGMAVGSDATAVQASTQFWFFLPYILFSVFGGFLADRLPRKWLMFSCDEIRGLILLLAFFLLAAASGPATLDEDQHWKVYATLFAIGTFASIFNPTRNAIIPQIIPTAQLPAGNALILVINVVASQIGIVIGGQIIHPEYASTIRTGLLLGAAFYLISGCFFAFLKPRDAIRPKLARKRSLSETAGYILQHRRILILIGIGVMVWSSAATVTSAILGLAKVHYGLLGDELLVHFTLVNATLGGGMLIGAAIIILIRTRKEISIIITTSLVGAGACVLLLALVPWKPITYLAALCIGMFGNIVIVAIITMLQSISPNYIRGRVMGLNAMINTTCSVSVYLAIWKLPNADMNIRYVLYVLSPALMMVGGFALVRHLRSGPMPSPIANFFARWAKLYSYSYHRMQVIDRHHLPMSGPVMIASNHTAAIDPFLIQASFDRPVRWVMLTNHLYRFANPLWRTIRPIALDMNGGDLTKLRKIVNALKENDPVGLFPEGGLQREQRELKPFQPGVAMIALRSKAPIVPAWIDGTPQRKNMLMQMLQPSHSTVVYGQPWTPDPGMKHEQVTDELRKRMLALRDRLHAMQAAENGDEP